MEYIGRMVRRTVAWATPHFMYVALLSRAYPRVSRALAVFIVGFAVFSTLAWNAPDSFPQRALITIEKGETLSEIAQALADQDIIWSQFVFKTWVVLIGGTRNIQAGDYFFANPEGALTVARRVSGGEYHLTSVRIVIPEGTTLRDMARMYAERLERFDPEEFLKITKGKEGYLFPDTYFFLPNTSAKQVADKMEAEFNERIIAISGEISAFGEPLNGIVTMASLLEEEARQYETRQIIAGILWRRIEIGMPLQVDAVFPYIIGKNTFELTTEDLAVDSPYNTYKYRGLPPGPITNPGIDAIRAAVNPIETDYLFYLSDSEGRMHYAEDFEGHKANKAKYLR